MNVLTIDGITHLPDALVEGYTSMIWTERYDKGGEFQLKTPKVTETLPLLPEGKLVTLLDSQTVMVVETQSIERDKDGLVSLTVTGRAFETFLENRALVGVYGNAWPMLQPYTTAEVCAYLVWNHLINATGQDPSMATLTMETIDVIPNLVVTDSTDINDLAKVWSLEEGEVYAKLLDFLPLANLGVRTVRPSNALAQTVEFNTSISLNRGLVIRTDVADIPDLRIDIYNGHDRTRNQELLAPVIFHYNSGHIDAPSYLYSMKDYKTMARVRSSIGTTDVWPDTGATPPDSIPNGLDRRILYVDGGTQGSDESLDDFTAKIVQKGLVEVKKHNRVMLFDGAISVVAPYSYGKDYFLGDKVTLLAEYGLEDSMIVSEYVRTEDSDGDRGYPTLILAD